MRSSSQAALSYPIMLETIAVWVACHEKAVQPTIPDSLGQVSSSKLRKLKGLVY